MDGTVGLAEQPLLLPRYLPDLYLPTQQDDWVHAHAKWKTLKHCCGGCEPLIGGFIDAGYDVLNPVQTSARGMDPRHLVDTFGDRIVFWGGGVEQQACPSAPERGLRPGRRADPPSAVTRRYVFSPLTTSSATPRRELAAMFQALGPEA
jgi:hypothetical protein